MNSYISVKFPDKDIIYFENFEDILKLENYDEIINIDCSGNNLDKLPEKLPKNLISLFCACNRLTSLPTMPKGLKYLNCGMNILSSLPVMPNSLIELICSFNKITSLSFIPENLVYLNYRNVKIKHLDYKYRGFKIIDCMGNPIVKFIENFFDGNLNNYLEFQNKTNKIFVTKISEWFLECKYNPKYLYCRKRLIKQYNDLYYDL